MELESYYNDLNSLGLLSLPLLELFFQPASETDEDNNSEAERDFFEQELFLFEKRCPDRSSSEATQWFLLAGLFYGAEILGLNALEELLSPGSFEILDGLNTRAQDLDIKKKLGKQHGSNVRPPRELDEKVRRKLWPPRIPRNEINRFLEQLKEIDGIWYIELVAELKTDEADVVRLTKEAIRQGLPYSIETREGRRFIHRTRR